MEQAQTVSPAPTTAEDTLREVRKRLVNIHYALVEGELGDLELQGRTRERLMDVMTYITTALGDVRPTRAPTAVRERSGERRR